MNRWLIMRHAIGWLDAAAYHLTSLQKSDWQRMRRDKPSSPFPCCIGDTVVVLRRLIMPFSTGHRAKEDDLDSTHAHSVSHPTAVDYSLYRGHASTFETGTYETPNRSRGIRASPGGPAFLFAGEEGERAIWEWPPIRGSWSVHVHAGHPDTDRIFPLGMDGGRAIASHRQNDDDDDETSLGFSTAGNDDPASRG